jgi:ABC-type transport system substrate-binding protein
MAIDRDAFADVVENRPAFAKEGLDVEVAYNSVLSAGWPGFWMDPKDEKTFGASAKYLQYNPAESKKLLAAAGLGNGAEYDFFHNRENTYGATYGRMVEIYSAMFNEIGLRARDQGLQYQEWLPQYHYGYLPNDFAAGKVKGFNGIGLAAERTRYTPVLSLFGLLDVNGDAFHGATTDGSNAVKGDAKLNADLDALRRETDHDKLVGGVRDVIRYATQQAYFIPKPSNPKFFTIWWPAIGNLQAFNSSVVGANIWAEDRLAWWIDQTKPPFKT